MTATLLSLIWYAVIRNGHIYWENINFFDMVLDGTERLSRNVGTQTPTYSA